MHDRPYLKGGVGPEITAAMTAIAREVKRETGLVLGIQVLAGANREALAIAHASGADFVRVEGFVYAHVADEGVIESCAGELLRYRRAIGAERVLVFADIKKKHGAHAITADVSIVETAKAAEFFLADGVIVTGAATGEPASPDEVRDVVRAVRVPVLVGSGITPANLAQFSTAHGFIVGSSVKQGGVWCNPLDRDAVRRSGRRVCRTESQTGDPVDRAAGQPARRRRGACRRHDAHGAAGWRAVVRRAWRDTVGVAPGIGQRRWATIIRPQVLEAASAARRRSDRRASPGPSRRAHLAALRRTCPAPDSSVGVPDARRGVAAASAHPLRMERRSGISSRADAVRRAARAAGGTPCPRISVRLDRPSSAGHRGDASTSGGKPWRTPTRSFLAKTNSCSTARTRIRSGRFLASSTAGSASSSSSAGQAAASCTTRMTSAFTRWDARTAAVVDQTGAGDAFGVGLILAHLEGLPIEACLQRAVVTASFAVAGWGPEALLAATRADAEARLRQWYGGEGQR